MFKRFINSVRKVLRKAIVAVAAIAVIMATAGALIAGLIWSAKIGVIVALCSVGVLLLCLLIDKDAAQEGMKKATEAVGKIAEGAGNIIGSITGGLVGGAAQSSGLLGLILIVGGGYLLYWYISEEKGQTNVEHQRNEGNREFSSKFDRGDGRYDRLVQEAEDSETEGAHSIWLVDTKR